MKYESIHNLTIPKIGFGTWSIGGGSTPDPKLDSISLTALRSALETGYTHFDTAEAYAAGHSEELIGRAIRETDTNREDVFITTKVSPENLSYKNVLNSCENSLRRLKTEYIDLYLIHWPGTGVDYNETFRALNELVDNGKVMHLGVSNFNLNLLKQAKDYSKKSLITNQVPYRVTDRTYVNNGVLEYCQQNDVLLTAYSPIKFRGIKTNKTLSDIAKKHSATSYQIALAWLVMQPRVITIPMSFNPHRIKENFASADIELSRDEIDLLTH